MNSKIKKPQLPEGFLTPEQTAEILNVSTATIYNYIKQDKLKAIRIGGILRVPIEGFNDFIEKSST